MVSMLCNFWYLVLWNWILVWWWALNSLDWKTLQSAVCETHYRGDLKPAVTLQVRSQTPGSRWAGAGLRLQTWWYPHSAARTWTGKRGSTYFDQPLKHVCQRQEGDEAIILVGENHFLQEGNNQMTLTRVLLQPEERFIYYFFISFFLAKETRRVNSRLSLWESQRNLPPHFHGSASLP